MMRQARRLAALLLMALAAGTAAPAMAGNERPLPEALVYDQGGMVISTAELPPGGAWVLIVLDASLESSQRLLTMLASRQDGYGDKVVVVAIGNTRTVQALVERNLNLKGVRWYSDRERNLRNALQLQATPVIYAMSAANEISWQLVGTPSRIRPDAIVAKWTGAAPQR